MSRSGPNGWCAKLRAAGGEFVCFYCKAPLRTDVKTNSPDRATVDHVIPLSRGGKNRADNVVLCCRGCNVTKDGMTDVEFAEYQRNKWLESQRGKP